jgi:hypothetical protein
METSVQTVTADVAKMATKLDYVGEEVRTSGTNLANKLDAIASKFDTHRFETDARLKPIEDKERHRDANWGLAKKFIVPVFAALAGVFGTKFGEELINWFVRGP